MIHREIHRASKGAVFSYSLGGASSGLLSTVPSILLLYFCTSVLGIPPAQATAIVFFPKAAALLLDPLAGSLFDRIAKDGRKRGRLMLAGGLVMCVGFLLVFSPPELGSVAIVVWMLLSYGLLAVGYSVFQVGHVSLPAVFAADGPDRARWMSWRTALVLAGVMAGAVVAPILVSEAGGGRSGYQIMAAVLGLFLVIGVLVSSRTAGALASPAGSEVAVTRRSSSRLLRSRPLLTLTASYLLTLCGAGLMSASLPYWMVEAVRRPVSEVGTAMGLLLVGALATIPCWTWLGRRQGDRKALVGATVIYAAAVGGLSILFASDALRNFQMAGFLVAGIGFGGIQVLPFVLLAHLSSALAARGEAGEGTVTGIFTAVEKLGLALGPAIAGGVLWAFAGEVTPAAVVAAGALACGLILAAALILAIGVVEQ